MNSFVVVYSTKYIYNFHVYIYCMHVSQNKYRNILYKQESDVGLDYL